MTCAPDSKVIRHRAIQKNQIFAQSVWQITENADLDEGVHDPLALDHRLI